MEHYTIAKCNTSPDWSSVEAVSLNNMQWLPDAGIRTTAQISYDESALYIHMRSIEKNIRAEYKSQNCPICQDSCVEFFFRPEENDSRYMNFEVNLNGQFYIGIGHDRNDNVRVSAPKDAESRLFCAKGNLTEDGWEIFYKIPVSFLRLFFPDVTFTKGKRLFANLYKCGGLTKQPHYITWNNVNTETPDYHRPEYFGEMVLG